MLRTGRVKAGKCARAAALIPLSRQKYCTVLDSRWHYHHFMSGIGPFCPADFEP